MILAYSLFSKSDFKKIFKDLKCEEPCHTVLVTGLVQALGKSLCAESHQHQGLIKGQMC